MQRLRHERRKFLFISGLILLLFAIMSIVRLGSTPFSKQQKLGIGSRGPRISLRVSAIRSTTVLKPKPCEIPIRWDILSPFQCRNASLAEGGLLDREINLVRKKHRSCASTARATITRKCINLRRTSMHAKVHARKEKRERNCRRVSQKENESESAARAKRE